MTHLIRTKFVLLLVVTGALTLGAAWWMSSSKSLKDAYDGTQSSDYVHGNDDSSDRLHIVYEIYAAPRAGRPVILKYGISGQYNFVLKWGNPRPEYQLPFYQLKYPGMSIGYHILHRDIPGRAEARRLEQRYVKRHFNRHRRMPLEQILPNP